MTLRVGLIANPRYPDLGGILAEAVRHMISHGWSLSGNPELARVARHDFTAIDFDAIDLLVTFGGDGTLLRGARALAGRPVPVLGINFGRIGFLTTVAREQAREAIDGYAAGNYWISSRAMLAGQVCDGEGGTSDPVTALNDVVLHKGGVARVVRFNLQVDGDVVGAVSADGVVVASPTGSTAYSLSAGGPVVAPTIDAMILTPICPHSLSVRPVVVPGAATIRITPLEPEEEELLVSFDGQQTAPLPARCDLEIRIAESRVHLVRFPTVTFFGRLREKLHWGDLSGRA